MFQYGYTPLHLAADRGHTEVCRLLITEGNADVNATSSVNINFKLYSFTMFTLIAIMRQQMETRNKSV